MSRVFIGLPTYNGGRRLSQAIDSIRGQTFTNWSLFISDNASQDDTQEICERAAATDPRIRYHRQTHNIGVWNNLKFLLAQADAEFFAWFPDDYVMKPGFLGSCVRALDSDPGVGMATTNVIMADDAGRAVEIQTDAYRVIRHGDRGRRLVLSYLVSREISLLFYSVFRKEVALAATQPYWNDTRFRMGVDCYIVLRALTLKGLAVDRSFELQTRHEERWTRRTWTFDHANLGGGFGFGFATECLRCLPWKWRPMGFVILTTRLGINIVYKLTYVHFLYGWRGVWRKAMNVYQKFRPRRIGSDVDQRTH
jgi:glycosyltransferase involved in cell wall biosynthesis